MHGVLLPRRSCGRTLIMSPRNDWVISRPKMVNHFWATRAHNHIHINQIPKVVIATIFRFFYIHFFFLLRPSPTTCKQPAFSLLLHSGGAKSLMSFWNEKEKNLVGQTVCCVRFGAFLWICWWMRGLYFFYPRLFLWHLLTKFDWSLLATQFLHSFRLFRISIFSRSNI